MGAKPTPLEAGYTAEFDTVDRSEWYKIINQFSDANIYQTWDYDAVRFSDKNISHLVLRKEGQIVAAAQARLVRIPILGLGAAYIRWAPFWQLRDNENDPSVFRMAIRALRNEYVCKRGFILRIFPLIYDDNSGLFHDILNNEGYNPVYKENPGRTLIMDINSPLEDIRKKFDQKWRNCLNKSERNQLEIVEGTDDNLFEDFIGLYRELLLRKQFQEPNDINEFRMIQQALPPEQKMRVFLCRTDGKSSAGAICGTVGDTGIYIFGATNDHGMKNKGSYLLQWKAIQWMKDIGCHYYNLNGINPVKNPGGYHFKSGLSGKNGKDVFYLGRFDCYSGLMNSVMVYSVDSLLPSFKKLILSFK